MITNKTVKYKDIPGYEGKYQVSSLGEIIRLPDKGAVKTKILKGYSYGKGGNLYIGLCENGYRKRVRICDEVARAFIQNPEQCKFVGRKDGDINNNRVENLFWTNKNSNRRKVRKNIYLEFSEWYFDKGEKSKDITKTYEYYISHVRNN